VPKAENNTWPGSRKFGAVRKSRIMKRKAFVVIGVGIEAEGKVANVAGAHDGTGVQREIGRGPRTCVMSREGRRNGKQETAGPVKPILRTDFGAEEERGGLPEYKKKVDEFRIDPQFSV